MSKPTIPVACAIIERGGLILAVQRKAGEHLSLKWEFPGGKIEMGESPEQCIVREIWEELDLDIGIISEGPEIQHEYSGAIILMKSFRCQILDGIITLNEHENFTWLKPAELNTLDWAEADVPIVRWIEKQTLSEGQ
ncbi:MAG: (deoxy)nucleoside triphosphate pyrophosphohydrolase [Bacteroidetes bacterium]|nr:(deoxy)nucleoside triphosphate pyrophosphohydrolase [Bacteroidota bacterium]